jgi:hypothetical protein
MNVNRQNYETFFLLYVDRELNEAQRLEVELFIQQNPDLAPELDMLAATTLEIETAEPIVFPGKESLFQQEIREDLLLYIDHELSTAATTALETEIAASANLQQQLTALQQAVLPATVVEFAHKEQLYRHEERRIVPFAWGRIAMVAALAGIAITGWWLLTNNPPAATGPVAAYQPAPATKTTVTAPATQQPGTAAIATIAPPASLATVSRAETVQQPGKQPSTASVPTQADRTQYVAVVQPEQPSAPVLSPADKQIAPVSNHTVLASLSTPATLPAAKAVVTAPATTAVQPEKQAMASNDIVYKELDTSDENEYLYVGSLEINKNKLTGFLKRAGRLLGGKAKNPDHL